MVKEYSEEVLDDGVDLSIPWKMHILVVHLPQFLKRHQVGMQMFAEQTVEATHSDFFKTHKRFKVAESHPLHGKRLRRSMVEYSSRRL